ncbi:MAG: prephenate dehydrogenase/arogenate dehydrogenase family protein [Clostridia bacterium]|nr:prephenate dehydrogenase/arogenate dehydrogenase family protein [Clostridia bacterium]
MIVGIVGLGLIGGSAAKAYKNNGGHIVYAYDTDTSMLDFAKMTKTVDETLTYDNISKCDLVIIALYPEAAIEYMKKTAEHISENAVVIDFCGTKREVCAIGFELAQKHGFLYVGGHPMAGTQFSGYANSRDSMFYGAGMVIVPPEFDDIEMLERIKTLLAPLGFGKLSATSAEKHDELIAFTSQMPHIVSNAFIKSPTSREHFGFSAGSYRDMTRVAWLNPKMWTELFLENRDNLIKEMDTLINELEKYKDALERNDGEKLYDLLDEGRRIKSEVDG